MAWFNDDEPPAASNLLIPSGNLSRREIVGRTMGLVTIKEPTYSRDYVALTADEVTVVLELNATSSTAVREGLDLVAVLDVSGGMEGEKLASIKNAMHFIIEKLTPFDRLSIVAFSNSATRICPLRSVTQLAQADLTAIVDGLVAGGVANIEVGIKLGLDVIANRAYTRARTANVFLMSDADGQPNVDLDPGSVDVYTFGFGKDAHHQLLSDVAGTFISPVPDGQNVTQHLSQLLGALLTVVARDVQLTLTPRTEYEDLDDMSVAPGKDYMQTTDNYHGAITVMFGGTLSSGETRKVAVKLTLNSSNETMEYDALLAEVQHSFIAQGGVREKQTPRDICIRRTPNRIQDPAAVSRTPQMESEPQLSLQYLKDITNNFSDVLGKGGFGVVYKGVLRNGQLVAVKKSFQAMQSTEKQFENEVNLLMKLKHPNIVRLIGYCYDTQHLRIPHDGKFVFTWNTESLLCLEYVPNGTLEKYISDASSGLDWHTRCKIIEGVSYGLQYLHENSNELIIHLDLKPANILLDGNMLPKITDFGLSRLYDRNHTIQTKVISGTRGYMPPEYLERGIITPMSDIFSLGVIIMEVITGHRGYPDDIKEGSEDFIKLELEKWRNRLQKEPRYTSLEIDCDQIERCIQIGLICVNPERNKRPTMKTIIDMLQGLASINQNIKNELSMDGVFEEP